MMYFFIQCSLAKADRISVINEPLMLYRVHEGSLQRQNYKSVTIFYDVCLETYKYLSKENLYTGTIKESFYNYCLSMCYLNINKKMDRDSKKEVYDVIKNKLFQDIEFTDFYSCKVFPDKKDVYKEISIIKKHRLTTYVIWKYLHKIKYFFIYLFKDDFKTFYHKLRKYLVRGW